MTVQSVVTKKVLSGDLGGLLYQGLVPGGVIVGCISDAAIPLLSGYCFDSCGMQDDILSTLLLLKILRINSKATKLKQKLPSVLRKRSASDEKICDLWKILSSKSP